MPRGKAAGEPCVHLSASLGCKLFGDDRRPEVCKAFRPEPLFCGETREQALVIMTTIELDSRPPGA